MRDGPLQGTGTGGAAAPPCTRHAARVAVVVVNYNTAGLTVDCLRSLARERAAIDHHRRERGPSDLRVAGHRAALAAYRRGAVYAVWAVREGVDLRRTESAFVQAKQCGLSRAGVIAAREAPSARRVPICL